MDNQKLVEVYRAENATAAHILKAALENEGIRVIVEGELLQGAIGEVPPGWLSNPRLLVDAQNVAKARQILSENEKLPVYPSDADEEGDDSFHCLSCGAEMEEGEDVCPKCGWSYQSGADS